MMCVEKWSRWSEIRVCVFEKRYKLDDGIAEGQTHSCLITYEIHDNSFFLVSKLVARTFHLAID